jgi:hypothetical protein
MNPKRLPPWPNVRLATAFLILPAAVVGAVAVAGCSTDLCEYVTCVNGAGGTGGATSSSATMSTSTMSSMTTSSMMTSTSTGVMPGCDLTEGMAVAGNCGVFVKNGAAGGMGTQAAPYGSVGEATSKMPGKAIYVCGGDLFNEAVVLGGSSLFGGLSCTDWTFKASNSRPTISGPPGSIAVTSINMGSRIIDSVIIQGAAGVTDGQSSVGLLVSDGTMLVGRSNINAATGAKGKAGEDGGTQGTKADDGKPGTNACGMMNPTPGGAEIDQSCNGTAMASVGGNGGAGRNLLGDDGAPGFFGAAGQKGLGEQGAAGDCAVDGFGHNGSSGSPGMVGLSGTDKGVLDTYGFTPTKAGDGLPGVNGQGGGGGGGKKGPATCPATGMAGPGASGGSGGAGGCGGLPGTAGTGGGSSFSIIALNANLSFSGVVSLSASDGGDGGDGGHFQPGTSGGFGANGGGGVNGSKNACRGGDGGQGGNGGGGGGGRGGHSANIVFLGTAPNPLNVTFAGNGAVAPGGIGQGNGAVGGNNGMAGASCKILDFATESCVM